MMLPNVLLRAQDGAAQRRVLEGRRVQQVKDHLLRDGVHLLHLAQDHTALALNL